MTILPFCIHLPSISTQTDNLASLQQSRNDFSFSSREVMRGISGGCSRWWSRDMQPPPSNSYASVTQREWQGRGGQQQLLVLYLPPALLGTALLGRVPLPGSYFLQDKSRSKNWQDPTCRPPARKMSLSTWARAPGLSPFLAGGQRGFSSSCSVEGTRAHTALSARERVVKGCCILPTVIP